MSTELQSYVKKVSCTPLFLCPKTIKLSISQMLSSPCLLLTIVISILISTCFLYMEITVFDDHHTPRYLTAAFRRTLLETKAYTCYMHCNTPLHPTPPIKGHILSRKNHSERSKHPGKERHAHGGKAHTEKYKQKENRAKSDFLPHCQMRCRPLSPEELNVLHGQTFRPLKS